MAENDLERLKNGETLGKVEAINDRLKAAKVPVRVRQRWNSIYLRCSKLPPKPGDPIGKRYEIPFGSASAGNLARMETEAHSLWQAVVERRFDWADYDASVRRSSVVRDVVSDFRKHYLKTSDCSDRTFEKHWQQAVFDRLPQDSKISEGVILAAVWVTPENTRQRRQACQKLSKLAEFAEISVDLSPYQGTYGKRSVKPRELPSDEQIEEWYEAIPTATWKRIFARIVVFGLRPSESFAWRAVDGYKAQVQDAKSGAWRDTRAFHPRWAEEWELDGELPNISWRSNRRHEDISQRIATRLRAYGVTCQRYDLRHAWCVRVSVEYRIPVEVAAKWAGHSPDVHQSIYGRWIRGDQQDRVYQEMVLEQRGD